MAERTLIISSAATDWKPLTDVTWAAMAKYADRHDYQFFPWVADLKDSWINPATHQREILPVKGFVKMDLFLRWLPDYDRVCWLDADLLITNPEISLDELTYYSPKPLIIGYDHNAHHTTVIVARSSDLMYDFMWSCNNTGRKLFLGHDWVEMEAMRYFLQTPPYEDMVGYMSVKRLCPILHKEYLDAGLPERVSAKYGWEPGDFAVHFSALPLTRRVELARAISEQVG